jgi:transposase-like protein
MNIENHDPKTLLQAVRHYSNLDTCDAYMAKIKWPTGDICCPECGNTAVGRIASRRMYQCKAKECRKQFSAKVGTIFEDSPLGLDKWFVAVWSITNAKNGISSCELARALGVTQKTAWFMLHRIRLAMKTKTFTKIGGNGHMIEVDETFIGGKSEFMHRSVRARKIKGGGPNDKTPILGLFDRRTRRVHAMVLGGHASRKTIHPIIHSHIRPGSEVITDSNASYLGLEPEYIHSYVDHAAHYVSGYIHTNSLENFWSTLKRALKGTYIRPTPEHLFRYLDEQILRFNEREKNDGQRFNHVMPNVIGRRIMYKELIGA